MRLYSANGPTNTASTGPKTMVEIVGSTKIRAQVCDLTVGNASTPNATDFQLQVAVTRLTATGTGTAFTPIAMDPGEIAASASCKITMSSEGTYSSNADLLSFYMNQRATYRWVAQDGREIYSTASSGNGLGLRMITAGQSMLAQGTVMWKE